jgi:hypothetical protein
LECPAAPPNRTGDFQLLLIEVDVFPPQCQDFAPAQAEGERHLWMFLMISGVFALAACSVTSISPTATPVDPSAIVSITTTPALTPLATALLTPPTLVAPIDMSSSSAISSTQLLNAQAAITAALKIASQGYIHLGGAAEPPTNVRATPLQVTAVADYLVQQGWPERTGDLGTIADTDVWVVTMDGTWQLIGGPEPPEGTTPAPYPVFHHYAIILDAKTGQDMGVFARP